jgi:hypothetical protein
VAIAAGRPTAGAGAQSTAPGIPGRAQQLVCSFCLSVSILNMWLMDYRLNQIEEDRLPQGYISKGFHFDQQTADELVELGTYKFMGLRYFNFVYASVHFGDEFRICEYVRTRQVDQEHGKYTLKDQNCRSTP